MADDPKKPARKSGTWHTQPSWPTVALVVAMLAAMLATYALTRGEDRTETILVLGAIGTTLAALMRPLFARFYTPLGALLAVSLALGASGCGASALRTHATIATVASASLGAAAPLVAPSCDLALSSCAGAEQCIAETVDRCRIATAAAEGLIASTSLYIDAIDAAALADEGLVLPALLALAGALARGWAAAVAQLASVGVTLPGLPPIVGELLVGGAS